MGRAGPALGIAAIGSFFAGCVATVVIAIAAPPLARVALQFGPAEYFSLMLCGLVAAIVLASGSVLKAIGMVILGPRRSAFLLFWWRQRYVRSAMTPWPNDHEFRGVRLQEQAALVCIQRMDLESHVPRPSVVTVAQK